MTSEIAIEIHNLTKIYKLYNRIRDRIKEAVHPFRKKYHKDFYALSDLSFQIKKGETVGIIGQNGSGKSTLLKIITGVLVPTKGSVTVNGKVSSLLELGTGFNPDMTGLENVFFFGTIHGIPPKRMKLMLDDILAFADIGEYIEQPVKTYSSGMFVRLAFSCSIHIEPEILIIDEALSVGDAYFQVKSMNKLKEFMNQGKTIILVSHDITAIKTLCKQAILLDKGRLIEFGNANDVVDFYFNMILKKSHEGTGEFKAERKTKENQTDKTYLQSGTGEIELLSLKLCNEKDEEISHIVSEKIVKLIMEFKAHKDLEEPHYGPQIKDKYGNSAFETNTYCMGIQTKPLKKGDIVKVTFVYKFNLLPGNYTFTIGVSNIGIGDRRHFKEYLFLAHNVKLIQVIENSEAILYGGYYNMNPKVIIE
ncbi:MAG: ABC transporter ATP-binding protein [Leptospiraceae bacterium]|nr:ABC transporter ATP-binding protein [Leptospiraceae bacterium]